MNKKHWGAVLAFSGLAIACGVAPSATWARSASHSHFDNRFYLTPSATYTLTENGRATNNGIGAGLAFGKRLTRFLEVEIITTWTRYKVTDSDKRAVMASQVAAGLAPTPQPNATRLLGIGGGINVFAFTDFSGLFSKWGLPFMSGLFDHLYVHGAILHSFATGQPGASAHNYQGNLFDAGLGYDIPLSFWDGAAIRLQALYRLDQHDQKDTGLHAQSPSGNYDEKVFSVGLRIPLGSRTSAAPRNNTPPSPVHIVQTQPAVVPPTPTPAPPPPCNAPQAGQTLHLVGCASGQRLVLHGVNFNLDKASLTPKA
ncbi:MAG: hypothetical protein L0H29_03200, partial [Sinobacteraceae bacterium]|nr:hypothetical protein [Nevskiaceae bacterium]